jgi:ABC-type Fe3+ transport system permease subunit
LTASPLERPAPFDDPRPNTTGTRAGRSAVSRRRARSRLERYAGLRRLFATAFVVTLAVVVYLGLLANVTRLNYALERSVRERAQLVDTTSRLDDRIAWLDSREHLDAFARKLGMHDAQTFVAIHLPTQHQEETQRGLAFLTWLR